MTRPGPPGGFAKHPPPPTPDGTESGIDDHHQDALGLLKSSDGAQLSVDNPKTIWAVLRRCLATGIDPHAIGATIKNEERLEDATQRMLFDVCYMLGFLD